MLILGFSVLVSACSDTTDTTTTSAAVPATSTTVAAVAPGSSTTVGEAAPSTTEAATTTTIAPLDHVPILITVEGGELTSELRVEVSVGDDIVLTIVSDTADEIHVHGYDLVGDIVPGEETVMAFAAVIPGIFEVELEGSHLEVLQLVVNQ